MFGTPDTLDEYIKKLEALRKKYGGDIKVWDNGGTDYPEPATDPYFRAEGDAYHANRVIVLS